MAVGARVQVKPVLGETENDRVTLSVNPLIGATKIVEDWATPGIVLMTDGLGETEKSVKVKVKASD